jgi:RNA polymerase-associated protein RTF1
MIARKRQLAANGSSTSLSVAERSRLTAQRTLAERRHDYEEMRQIEEQLSKLTEGGSGVATPAEEEPADRLTRVNERNRKANMEAVRKAELLEAERKRRERKMRGEGGDALRVIDPSARLKTVPRLFESATPTSRYALSLVLFPFLAMMLMTIARRAGRQRRTLRHWALRRQKRRRPPHRQN